MLSKGLSLRQTEAVGCRDRAETGQGEFALRHHGDEEVDRLLRHPVELLNIEQRPMAQRLDERTIDKTSGV